MGRLQAIVIEDRLPPLTKPDLRVALPGQGFMGKAHSNAYVQAPHFYDLPYTLRRTLLCGRDPVQLAATADRGRETSW